MSLKVIVAPPCIEIKREQIQQAAEAIRQAIVLVGEAQQDLPVRYLAANIRAIDALRLLVALEDDLEDIAGLLTP